MTVGSTEQPRQRSCELNCGQPGCKHGEALHSTWAESSRFVNLSLLGIISKRTWTCSSSMSVTGNLLDQHKSKKGSPAEQD